jgi:hypothetical protein
MFIHFCVSLQITNCYKDHARKTFPKVHASKPVRIFCFQFSQKFLVKCSGRTKELKNFVAIFAENSINVSGNLQNFIITLGEITIMY